MTYNDANRLVTYNGQKVKYDEKGNMTYGPVDGVMQELTYDCRNRLVEAGGVSYTYDAENTRIATTENGLTTEYVTDTGGPLSRLLVAYEADNTETTYYYGAEGLAAQYNSGTGKYYAYHYDNIGSTTLITARDGHAVERFSYGTYGELLKEPITKIRFLYNGSYGVATDSNGLYYMRARYYNSDIKRFINQDIKVGDIGSSQSLNRYAYCEGNPVSMVDPFGLCGEDANDQGEKSKYGWIHEFLDFAGIFFDPADLINGALYAAEGDWGNAALCAVSFIPAVGSVIVGVAKSAKAIMKARKAEKILSLAKESCRMTKNAANTLDTFTDTMRAASKWGDNPLKLVDGITAEAGSKAVRALETGGDFAKESKKAVWEMKAVSGGNGIRLKTSVDEGASLFKQGFAGTNGVAKSARKSGKTSTIDRIRNVAQQSFDYAVNNPRRQGLNRMQLGKDAEIQATRWMRKWAKRNGIDLSEKGLRFQVRGGHSIPDIVYEPTQNIMDFKLTPKAVRKKQSDNFKSDFIGYSIEYIFGPGPWRK